MRGNGTENLQGKREGRKVREVREKKEGVKIFLVTLLSNNKLT